MNEVSHTPCKGSDATVWPRVGRGCVVKGVVDVAVADVDWSTGLRNSTLHLASRGDVGGTAAGVADVCAVTCGVVRLLWAEERVSSCKATDTSAMHYCSVRTDISHSLNPDWGLIRLTRHLRTS